MARKSRGFAAPSGKALKAFVSINPQLISFLRDRYDVSQKKIEVAKLLKKYFGADGCIIAKWDKVSGKMVVELIEGKVPYRNLADNEDMDALNEELIGVAMESLGPKKDTSAEEITIKVTKNNKIKDISLLSVRIIQRSREELLGVIIFARRKPFGPIFRGELELFRAHINSIFVKCREIEKS